MLPVVRYALEGRVLAGWQVGVGAAAQQELEDVAAVVSDRGTQRRVDAVLFGVGVYAGVEENGDGLHAVDAGGELQDARAFLVIGPVLEEHLQALGVVRGRPQHVLRARQVGVGPILEQGCDNVGSGRLDGVKQSRLALLVLVVGVGAIAQQHLGELPGRLLVDGADEQRVAVPGPLVGVAAIHEQQVDEADVVGGRRDGEGGLQLGARRHVGIGAVHEQRGGAREEVLFRRGDQRADAVSVRLVGVGAVQEQEAQALGVLAEDGFVEGVGVGAGVGRDAAIKQLQDELVVLGAGGRDEGVSRVDLVAVNVAAGPAPRHGKGLALEVDHL
ncbi:hypothetical protein G6O67_005363 [Ophiocordyceps sinensis]|uniref:Uncharacterized protein n=1 Tax=Ophiocordyceps sinensis TaxID=72228 RepID=A0A8H4V5U1_9HYPO|nr:hypothetical protein G6O67_005363 [Ophiocordyceps sinensis]